MPDLSFFEREEILLRAVPILCLLAVFALPALAVEDGHALYVGGTVATLAEGQNGKLDTSSPTDLVFIASSLRLAIPFANIDSYEHYQDVAHHLGVVPAVAVALVKKHQRKHFLRIAFRDDNKIPQVAIFEIPKSAPSTILAILQQRAPFACEGQLYSKCRPRPN